MFWIGFIVGMVVLALAAFGFLAYCLYGLDMSWKNFGQLVEINEAAILNRDCVVKVCDEDTGEEVFETGFKYPWSDEEDDE